MLNISDSSSLGLKRSVSAAETSRYLRHGVVVLRQIVDTVWVQNLGHLLQDVFSQERVDLVRARGRIDGESNNVAPNKTELSLVESDANRWHRGLKVHYQTGPLPSLVGALTQSPSVSLLGDQLFLKQPMSMSETPLHQDRPLCTEDTEAVAVAWMPIDSATDETGAMLYVPGSHRWGRNYLPSDAPPLLAGWLQANCQPAPKIPRDDPRLLRIEAEPGDVVVHDWALLHGSTGNQSAQFSRRSASVRYRYGVS